MGENQYNDQTETIEREREGERERVISKEGACTNAIVRRQRTIIKGGDRMGPKEEVERLIKMMAGRG